MTCYLPPCCNLSSSPIRQPFTARPAAKFRQPSSAIPRSLLPSRFIHICPSYGLKVSRLLLRRKFLSRVSSAILSTTSHHPAFFFPATVPPLLSCPRFCRVRFFFLLGCKLALCEKSRTRMKEVDDRAEFRLKTQKRRPDREKLRDSQNKQSVSQTSSSLPRSRSLSLICLRIRGHGYLFFGNEMAARCRTEIHSVRHDIISVNGTYKISAVALR